MNDDELDRLRADLDERLRRSYNERADEILARIDEEEARPFLADQVVLLGLDGEVDAMWSVPEPLPEVLRRPIKQRLTASIADPTRPTFTEATYRRVGQFTYLREKA